MTTATTERSVEELKERLETLEREFEVFRNQMLSLQPPVNDWRRTVGTLERDELTLEAERYGREWRARSPEV